MSAVMWLHDEAAYIDQNIDRLTADIEAVEERIVKLRQERDDARFRRAELLAAASVLANVGFHVDRDAAGVPVVHVDPVGRADR